MQELLTDFAEKTLKEGNWVTLRYGYSNAYIWTIMDYMDLAQAEAR